MGEFLKWVGAVPTGGIAKLGIQQGKVTGNGEVERRRGRQLRWGDAVTVGGREYRVAAR